MSGGWVYIKTDWPNGGLVPGWLTMRLARVLLFAMFVLATPALAADPHPAQLAVSFLAEPAPIVQDGGTRLLYEMQIVNYTKSAYILDAVEAKAVETSARFRGAELEAMIRRFGEQGEPVTSADRTIEPGRGAIVFLMLDLGQPKHRPRSRTRCACSTTKARRTRFLSPRLRFRENGRSQSGALARAMDRGRLGEQQTGRRASPPC